MLQEEYVKEVMRKLECSDQKKAEIRKELLSNIQTALTDGETWDEVRQRMGTPEQMAAEFNENLSSSDRAGGKKKKKLLTFGIIAGILIALAVGIFWALPKSYELEASGIFQEETVLEEANKIIVLLDQSDYAALEECAIESMQPLFQGETSDVATAKETLGGSLGENQGCITYAAVELRQFNKRFATVQMVVQYENRSVTYTISFDRNMKLAGLYMM